MYYTDSYIHCIISLKLLPCPKELISLFQTSNVHDLCICGVHVYMDIFLIR